MMKKFVLVVLDGMADDPKGTLLEECNTPNMDEMCLKGSMGTVSVLPKSVKLPQSDEAIFSLLGMDTSKGYPGRGPVEALGCGCIKEHDKNYLALRTNFETVGSRGSIWNSRIKDRRVGRSLTTKEAKILGKSLNGIDIGCDFTFMPTVEHRGALVLKGEFWKAADTDPSYKGGGSPRKSGLRELDSFIEQAHELLSSHRINKERAGKGMLQANAVLTRDAGSRLPDMKAVMSSYGMKWCAIVGMPLEIGIAKVCGMGIRRFKYPEISGKSLNDLYGKHFHPSLEKTSRMSEKLLEDSFDDFDAFWLHLKEFDIAGHDGRRGDKKKMIETADRNLFSFLNGLDAAVVVTSDHATPCRMKSHSSDRVPLVLYGKADGMRKTFSEKDFAEGSLGNIKGHELITKVMGMMR